MQNGNNVPSLVRLGLCTFGNTSFNMIKTTLDKIPNVGKNNLMTQHIYISVL